MHPRAPTTAQNAVARCAPYTHQPRTLRLRLRAADLEGTRQRKRGGALHGGHTSQTKRQGRSLVKSILRPHWPSRATMTEKSEMAGRIKVSVDMLDTTTRLGRAAPNSNEEEAPLTHGYQSA